MASSKSKLWQNLNESDSNAMNLVNLYFYRSSCKRGQNIVVIS